MNRFRVDIAIIGSGAGGGTIASELAPLAAQGLKIALFESGGEWAPEKNRQTEIDMASKYYVESGGLMNEQMTMTFALGKAVGGSTTVYTGTSLKLPEDVAKKWDVPTLTHEDLKPRFEKYIRQNNIHLLDESELNLNNLLFRKACQSLGWKHAQFPLNVIDCQGLSTCNLGCASGAKQGTHRVQIPVARAAGVEVYSWADVLEIEGNELKVRVSPPQHGLPASKLEPGEYRICADRIIVCAGTFGTPALLGRSGGFDHLPALGRYLTCHPGLMIAGKHPRSIGSPRGHPKSFYCDEFVEQDGFLLETCMYFPFTLSKNLWGFGQELSSFIDPFENLQMILALAIDEPDEANRVVANDHFYTVKYELSPAVIHSLVESMKASAEIMFEAGAETVHLPASDQFLIHRRDRSKIKSLVSVDRFKKGRVVPSAAHLMGTCRMGTSPETSVTDPWGRVHGRRGIYVADASLFPRASEVNPYLTVMALADRVAEGIKRELGA